jgi:hypothetical protein
MIAKPPIESMIPRYGMRLRKSGVEWIGPCPVDGGTNRFSINVKKQLWNCRGCNRGGDVIDLIQHIERVGYKEAVRILGCNDARPISYAPVLVKSGVGDDNSAAALAIWHDATDIDHPLVHAYFASRKLAVPTSPDVRFHPACPYGSGAHFPCIVALYRNILTDAPQAIHRTAIPRGRKLGRLTYGPTAGAVIKLSADEEIEQRLTIGEGVETTLAGMALGYTPAWATGSAPGIRKFPVLPGIDTLTILVDADEEDRNGRRAGQDTALECSERWTEEGREVWRIVPRRIGADMADVWAEEAS